MLALRPTRLPRRLASYSAFAIILVAFAMLAAVKPAAAATLTGQVVGLTDGDTVTVLDASKTQHKVRLAGIDAPEKRQPFGDRSRQSLAALVFGHHVLVEWNKTDRYGRLIGKVVVSGRDACLEQVRRGMAWHYKAYAREQSPADQVAYASAEDEARRARRGLWRDTAPVAPWEFRHGRR